MREEKEPFIEDQPFPDAIIRQVERLERGEDLNGIRYDHGALVPQFFARK